jgi:hypothetical protein
MTIQQANCWLDRIVKNYLEMFLLKSKLFNLLYGQYHEFLLHLNRDTVAARVFLFII